MSNERGDDAWSEDKYKKLLLASRPTRIQDLWSPFRSLGGARASDHSLAHDLFIWAKNSEIEELLSNEQELKKITFSLIHNLAALGQMAQENNLQQRESIVLVPPCSGCSDPCDASFATCDKSRQRQRIPHDHTLHTAILQCTVLSQLLTHEKSDLLCTVVSREFPSNVKSVVDKSLYIQSKMMDGDPQGFLPCLVGNFDNLTCFPKLCHISGGLMSLIVARRPAASFDILGESLFCSSVAKYMRSCFPLVCNNKCIVDEYFGIAALLNLLPLIYLMGSWKSLQKTTEFADVSRFLITVIENVCFQITEPSGNSKFDKRPDLEELPETRSAQIVIEPLERRTWRKDLLSKHPHSFLVIASIEVLGWFSHNGVDLNNIRLNMDTGEKPDVPKALREFKDRYYEVIRRVEEYEYIKPVLDALIDRKRAPSPDPKLSLLNGPLLDSCKRCALHSCRKNKKDIGRPLSKCAGNCAGLVYYCCKEHQKEHWKYHKNFCRNCWK